MKSHTQIKFFNCEGFLRFKLCQKIYLEKISCTSYWSLEGIFCLLFPSSFLTRKTGYNYSQVLNCEQRLWFFYWCKANKHYNPTLHHIPVSLISSLVQATLCLQAGLQLPEPCEWEGQKRSHRTTTIWWKYWCRNVTLGQFLDLLPGAFPAERMELLTIHCSPAGPPSWRGWDVTSRNICRLLTT